MQYSVYMHSVNKLKYKEEEEEEEENHIQILM